MIKPGDRDRKLPVEGRDKDLQQQTQIDSSRGSTTHFKNHTLNRKQLCAWASETSPVGQLTSRCKKSWEEKESYSWSQVHAYPKLEARPEGYMVAAAMVDCIN